MNSLILSRTVLTAAAFLSITLKGQVISVTSGDWNNPSVWSPPGVPDFNAGPISISHSITIPNGYSVDVDQLSITSGGTLVVQAGGNIRILNGSGVDLTITGSGQISVSGIVECADGATFAGTSASNTIFNSGGTYRHMYTSTEGVIPLATWLDGANLEISGFNTTIVASASGNWSQAFANVVINCTALNSRGVLFQGLLNNARNLLIQSTGSNGWVELTRGQTATLNISGDLIVTNQSRLYVTSGGNVTLNIGNDFIFNSTALFGSYTATTGTSVINIGRDFLMNAPGGLLRVAINAGSGQTTFNITRHFNLIAGKLEEFAPSGLGTINFTAPGTHVFHNSGQILNTFNYYVGPSATVDLGTSPLTGDGIFTLDGTIIVRSTSSSGAISSTATAGNIQLPLSNRIYNSGSTIIYEGTSGQTISSGHPSVSGVQTVFNNSVGVTLVNNITFGGNVVLQSGSLNMGSYSITMQGPNWLANGGSLNYGLSGTVTFNGSTNIGGSSIPSFRHIIVSSSSVCTLVNHLNLFGDITIQTGGTFNTSTYELRLTGNPTQTISANGASVHNITINKTGGNVVLNSALSLTGVLKFISSTNLITNNYLTIRSTNDKPAADGSIAALPAGAIITGDVTVERYFGAADNVDRFISSPISNASVAQLQDDFAVTGNFTGTSFPCTGCLNNGASLRWYDETVINAPFKSGYKPTPVSGGSNSELLIPGVGYDTYMWNGVSPIVWDVTGTINRGTINFTVSHTPSSPPIPTDDGWNLVGNPYPSAIQWNNGSGWSRTNIDPTVWVWDVVAKIWRSFNYNTMLGNLTDGIIALGQAFWVYVPSPGPASMSINEAAKSTMGSGSYYRSIGTSQYPYLSILVQGGGSEDEAFILLSNDVTADFNSGIDAPKLRTGQESLSLGLVAENRIYGHLGINPTSSSTFYIPIDFRAEEGNYRFTINTHNWDIPVYLIDLKYQSKWSLSEAKNVSFYFTSNDIIQGRFVLTNDINALHEERNHLVKAAAYPNPAFDYIFIPNISSVNSLSVMDVRGILHDEKITYSETEEGVKVDVSKLSAGTYLIRILKNSDYAIIRFIKL